MDPVRELKIRADILMGALGRGDDAARARLRVLKDVTVETAQRKHCLAIVAREAGFAGWEHAKRVLEGDARELDFGTMLYTGGMLNEWFASYDEARERLAEATNAPRFLLAYKRHFLVVEAPFIEALGMNPDDEDWRAIGWDWARPSDLAARARLYLQRLDAMRRAAA